MITASVQLHRQNRTVTSVRQMRVLKARISAAKVGTPRCGVPAPFGRGTGDLPSYGFVALDTECSAAERGGDGVARHPLPLFRRSRQKAL